MLQKKKSYNNVKSASNKNKVVSIDDNSTKNVVFEPDIEDKPNIDFYNSPEVLNDEYEPSIDFDDTLKLPIINNVVDCATQTSNEKSLCSKLFIKKDYFENFYDENQILKNNNNHLEQKIINLRKKMKKVTL